MCGDIGLLLGPISFGWAAGRLGFTSAFAVAAGATALVALLGVGSRETLHVHETSLTPTSREEKLAPTAD